MIKSFTGVSVGYSDVKKYMSYRQSKWMLKMIVKIQNQL